MLCGAVLWCCDVLFFSFLAVFCCSFLVLREKNTHNLEKNRGIVVFCGVLFKMFFRCVLVMCLLVCFPWVILLMLFVVVLLVFTGFLSLDVLFCLWVFRFFFLVLEGSDNFPKNLPTVVVEWSDNLPKNLPTASEKNFLRKGGFVQSFSDPQFNLISSNVSIGDIETYQKTQYVFQLTNKYYQFNTINKCLDCVS